MFCCFASLLRYLRYLAYGIFSIVGCLLSTLIISEKFRKIFFAKIFTSKWVNEWIKNLFVQHRPIYLKDFTELKPKRPNEKLRVLEVGVGDGANFELFPENCHLTVLDYNENFEDAFMKNIEKHPRIQLDKSFTGTVEDMHQFDDNIFDVVLITHVLCSVPDVPKSLSEVRRVLKEGGKYVFMEHVAYEDKTNKWSLVQRILQPLWKIMAGGCHLTRQTSIHIDNAGFKSVKINYSYPANVPVVIRPHIWGCAIK